MTMDRPSRQIQRGILLVAVTLCVCHTPVYAAGKDRTARPAATLTNVSLRPFLTNRIFNYFANDGDEGYNPFSSNNEGFEFPRGSERHFMVEAGLLWGGYHKGRTTAKVGGSAYRHALQPGPLLTPGTVSTDPVPADPTDPAYRMYRVRPDVRPDIPFTDVEAMLNADEVPYIARYEPVTARDLYDRYIADWNAWPAALGAPFTDVNMNGVYDPAVDIPGKPGADQTLWYVANDMNDSLTQRLAGCPPIGLEVHRTIWGYRRADALGKALFRSTVLVNKSGAPVDSMYIAQWVDTELGDPGDDLVGCDTTLDLGYTYNGRWWDAYLHGAPPAFGFVLLQGPMVPGAPTDTADFLSSRRPGFRDLRMTAFTYYGDGLLQYVDPYQGASGDLHWYRQMRGLGVLTNALYTDPVTGAPSPICVPGDPVKATDGSAGWVDGLGATTARDKRLAMSTGPFTLAAGDTQEVVIASLVGEGTGRLESITALRNDVRAIRDALRTIASGHQPPAVSCRVRRDSLFADLTLRVDMHHEPVVAVTVSLATAGGFPVAMVTLADAGGNGDNAAGDGVWTGTGSVVVLPVAYGADLTVTYADGRTVTWPHVLEHITTAPLTVASSAVASDNINNDGIANPGENVRFVFSLRNDAPFTLHRMISTSSPVGGRGSYSISILAAHATIDPIYDPANAGSYFTFDVPTGYRDSTIRVAIVTTDDSLNVWPDTLVFPVRPLPEGTYRTPMAHASGQASGAYTIRIVDPARVKPHLYVLRGGSGLAGPGSFTLKDSTTGTILLQDHPVPDTLGHTSPVVDGFKILRGTTMDNPGMHAWSVPQGSLRFSPVGGFRGLGLEGFSDAAVPQAYDPEGGTIGAAMGFRFGGIGSAITLEYCHTILLKLAAVNDQSLWDPLAVPADPNISKGYRYLRSSTSVAAQPSFAPWIVNKATGYPYQDYHYSVPFSAWDVDVSPPQRLAVGHLENNVGVGKVDGRYWPGDTTADNSAVRELAFIFAFPYTENPDPSLMVNLQNNATTPMMWIMTCSRRAAEPWPGNDQFMIVAHHYPTQWDAWLFNPSVVLGVNPAGTPSSFALLQNYPNPFNPSTTIRYDLPAQSEVTIIVYDILGRAVRHLVREVQPAGSHAVPWDANNDSGARVASGVYFYRCTAVRADRGGQFVQTMKMILLR